MAEIICLACNGKGHTTLTIAGDVHIAECKECLGWGTITAEKIVKIRANERYGKFAGGKVEDFGRLDNIKLDKQSRYSTVNLDELLKE